MANPPKQKGTGGERELVMAFSAAGFYPKRTSPGLEYDIDVPSAPHMGGRQVDALATRPDRGRWLVTITLPEFLDLLGYRGYGARVESKRYHRFSLHSLFEGKFGG